MKKWGKRVGIALASLVAIVMVLLGGIYAASASKGARHYDVAGANFEIPTDAASLAEGERLFVSRGCGGADCHGPNGAGHVMMQDGPLGTIAAANLTIAAQGFTAASWDRAVRHGLNANGRSLIFMPSGDYQHMSDHELALIVAHIRSLPLVSTPQPPCSPGMVARVVDFAGGFCLYPASAIDHAHVSDPPPTPGRNVAYGAELARLCSGCHGEHFSGGPIPGAPPELGTPLNITPDRTTGIGSWTEDQFRTVLREGRRPNGEQVIATQMPWPALSRLTDDEIGALWMYLQTVPARPFGER
jgi:mono/diheme cytochrome c family protein